MLANARLEERGLPVIDYAWAFLPGTSQEFALKTPAHHIFYHGTRGPGKTDCQLAKFAAHVGQGYGSHWTGIIFDRKYKNLDDLVKKSKRMFRKAFGKTAKFLESKSDYKWVWDTGEELLFRSYEKTDDYWNYHGQEFPFIGWNELCKYPSPDPYDSMMSCNRSSWTQEKDSPVDEQGNFLVPPIPLVVFSTTNPYGPGHTWVRERFIDCCPPGHVHKITTTVFHPGLKQDVEITKYQVAIFGSYKENPYLSPEYVAELENIKDESKRKAWLEGDWDIVAGGALSDLWKASIHIKPRFVVPYSWRIDRAMDWGSSHPCSIGWFAEANGEEAILPDGSTFCPPKGTIIQIDELYLAESLGKNVGLRVSAKEVAKKVIEKEIALMQAGWIVTQPWPGPADNQIRNVIDAETDTIEKMFADKGVRWQESDKAPGSRKNGLELFRGRLEAAREGLEEPAWYCTDNCRASIATLPTLPRDEDDPDDVDTDAIDHPYDMNRYRVLKGANRFAKKISVQWG